MSANTCDTMSMTWYIYIYICKVEQYLFTVYLCFFFFFNFRIRYLLLLLLLSRLYFRVRFHCCCYICFPYRFVKFNKTFIRVRGRDTRIPNAFESYGVPAVWKSLKNVRVVSKIRWSIVIGRMKKTDRAVPAKSCILRNGRCISRQEREHCGNEREMRTGPFNVSNSSYGRQPFPAWYRK